MYTFLCSQLKTKLPLDKTNTTQQELSVVFSHAGKLSKENVIVVLFSEDCYSVVQLDVVTLISCHLLL